MKRERSKHEVSWAAAVCHRQCTCKEAQLQQQLCTERNLETERGRGEEQLSAAYLLLFTCKVGRWSASRSTEVSRDGEGERERDYSSPSATTTTCLRCEEKIVLQSAQRPRRRERRDRRR
jgi:hypothetical protein